MCGMGLHRETQVPREVEEFPEFLFVGYCMGTQTQITELLS